MRHQDDNKIQKEALLNLQDKAGKLQSDLDRTKDLNDGLYKKNAQLETSNTSKMHENERLDGEKMQRAVKEERLKEEKKALEEQCTFYQDELKKTTALKREQNQTSVREISKLQEDLDSKTEEARSSVAKCATLQKKCEDLEARSRDVGEKLQQATDAGLQANEHSTKEMNTKDNLITLYKEQSEATKKKKDELLSAVTGFKEQLVAQRSDFEKQKAELVTQHADAVEQEKASAAKVQQLEEELTRANDLLPAAAKTGSVAQQFPVAHATSEMLKGADGVMTLTQAYSKWKTAEEELLQVPTAPALAPFLFPQRPRAALGGRCHPSPCSRTLL